VMQRVDHVMIYVLIAGSYTPLCVLALPRDVGVPLLVAAWAGAGAGILLKLARSYRVRLLSHSLYPLLGWMALVAVPAMVRAFSTVEMVLFVAAGVFYTGGIPVLARRRPDPWPRTFGYHELWHACTVAAAACHFTVVGLLVT
jgi:hemolysin III